MWLLKVKLAITKAYCKRAGLCVIEVCSSLFIFITGDRAQVSCAGRLARETSWLTFFLLHGRHKSPKLGCKLAITQACRKAGGLCVRKVQCVSFILSRGRRRRFLIARLLQAKPLAATQSASADSARTDWLTWTRPWVLESVCFYNSIAREFLTVDTSP